MNLFVISTPSQAFFLSLTPKLVTERSILLITKSRRNYDKRILSYLQKFRWLSIVVIDVAGIESITGYHKIFKFYLYVNFLLITKFKNVTKLFMGSYHNPFHLGIAALLEKRSELFLLYDGLQMVTVAEERKSELNYYIRAFTKIFIIAGFQSPKLNSITFITPLSLAIATRDKIVLIQPIDYIYPKLINNLIYFVGQPLVDVRIVSRDTYLAKLALIKEYFADSTIIYIPHPKESKEILEVIKLNFQIRNFDVIFEEEYIRVEYFPQTVISFYSSVLMNLCYLKAQTSIYAVEIFSHEIIKRKRIESISNIYHFFRKVEYPTFKVIKLSENYKKN